MLVWVREGKPPKKTPSPNPPPSTPIQPTCRSQVKASGIGLDEHVEASGTAWKKTDGFLKGGGGGLVRVHLQKKKDGIKL